MNRRRFLAATLSISLGTLIAGCGGVSPGGNASRTTLGKVTGALYKDSAGRLVLIRATDSAPPGTTPVGDASVGLLGGSASVRTDTQGRFLLQGLPAGLRTLLVEGGGLAPTSIPLTIIGDATVDIGVTPVSRSVALEKVKTALTAAGVADLAAVTLLSPQQPLPAGVFVVPRFAAATINASVAGANTLTRAAWFFFCDEHVGQPFAHPVRYIYVDTETGDVQTSEHTSWPTFNAQHFYPRADLNATSPDLIQPGRFVPSPSRARSAVPNQVPRATRAEDEGKLYELFLYGFNEAPSNIDFTSLWGHAGIPQEVARIEVADWYAENLRDRVTTVMKQLCQEAGSNDTVFLDINCHGGLDDTGVYFMWTPSGAKNWIDGLGSFPSEMMRIEELGLSSCRACTLIVLAGTCHSGAWITYAREALDVPGKTVTILAACANDHVSWGPLKAGKGIAFSEFVRTQFVNFGFESGQPGQLEAFNQAKLLYELFMSSQVLTQHPDAGASVPQRWMRTPTEGEDCAISITPQVQEVGTNQLAENFEIKLTNRPSSAPPVRIVVSTNLGRLSTAAGAGNPITLTEPGQVAFTSSEVGEALITAEAFEGSGSSEVSIGKATAKVTVKPLTVKITPSPVSLVAGGSVTLTPTLLNYKKVNPSHVVRYKWSLSGITGTLSPTITDDTSATSTTLTATTSATGSGTVRVEAILILPGNVEVPLATTSTPVTLDNNRLEVTGTVRFESELRFTHDSSGEYVMAVTSMFVEVPVVTEARRYSLTYTRPALGDVVQESWLATNPPKVGPFEVRKPEGVFWILMESTGSAPALNTPENVALFTAAMPGYRIGLENRYAGGTLTVVARV